MMFLFDTDYLSLLKRQAGIEFQRLSARLATESADDFFISIVSFHEQIRGWQNYISRSRDEGGTIRGYEELAKLLTDYSVAQVVPYDETAVEVFKDLRRQKVRVGTMDLRIGAIAISNNLTLLTRNRVDFERIPGLSFEDWTVD